MLASETTCISCGAKENLGIQPSLLQCFLGTKKKCSSQLEWEEFSLKWKQHLHRWACYACLTDKRALRGDPSLQRGSLRGPFLCFFDLERSCAYCDCSFVFSASEQRFWYEELQFHTDSIPIGCLSCRRRLREIRDANKELSGLLGRLQPKNFEQLQELSRLSWLTGNKNKAIEYLRRAKNCCSDGERDELLQLVAELEKTEPKPIPQRAASSEESRSSENTEVFFPSPLDDFIDSHAVVCDPRCCGLSAFAFESEQLEKHEKKREALRLAIPGSGFDLEEVQAQVKAFQAKYSGKSLSLPRLNTDLDNDGQKAFFAMIEKRIEVLRGWTKSACARGTSLKR